MIINLKNSGKKLKFICGFLIFILMASFINGAYFAPMIVGWLIHEMGHVVVGKLMDVRLRPEFGLLGVGMKEQKVVRGKEESLLASGGVIANLIWGVIAFILGLEYYYEASMLLAILNILPVLPLDGGKIVRGILSCYFSETKVTNVLAYFGQVLAMVFVFFVLAFDLRPVLLILPIMVYFLAMADVKNNEYRVAKQTVINYLSGTNKRENCNKIPC